MSLLAGGSNPVRSWRYAETGTESVVFTGPDASRDYRSKLPDFPHYIGENRHISAESTGDLNYLYRSARYDSYQKRKDCYVGEIGWGLCFGPKLNRSNLLSGMQIKLGEFRERAEDKVTHRYQNPWQPPPAVLNHLRDGRAFLAWPLKRVREGRESAWWKMTTVSPIHNTDSSTSNEMLDCEPLPPCEEGAAIPFISNEHIVESP
ncbi:protein SPMIP2 isoform X1 [Mobula hypostoma]|uniref:protein SPMIP2 isoform X1 n=1 Tax=Mobula hypostoma TaxID=723540 RepID=UPI002FC36404